MRALRPLIALLLVTTWLGTAWAATSPRYHTVASGQRLGSIAKRYGVSIDAMCTANGIDRKDRLKVGQKLLVPSRNDKDGSIARRQYGPPERSQERSRGGDTVLASSTSEPPRQVTHKVYAGQRLESIARRYQVTIEALCEANRIRKTDKLKPGQVLVIPGSLPDAGLSKVSAGDQRREEPRRSASKVKKGYVDLSTWTARYRGVVFDKKGKVAPGAIEAISRLFGATGSRPRVDPRLIALLAEVSQHFDGKPVRVVSGWRDHSYYDDSRHRTSQAVDLSIAGVPNTVLRDYLRRFRNCGVGYYPNSSFVHLDVRQSAAYWVDYAGPGEAPRSKPRPDPKDTKAVVATSEPSRPLEEAGADVSARPATPPAAPAPTKAGHDITSGASRSAPISPAAPVSPAAPASPAAPVSPPAPGSPAAASP